MSILLTGAGGFIGGYVLKFLLNAGYDTNILVRDCSKLFNTGNTKLKVFTGSITDIETVNESIKGCDIVIHLAARSDRLYKTLMIFLKQMFRER